MHRYWEPPLNYLFLPLSAIYWTGLQFWYLYDKLRRKVKFDTFSIVVGNLWVGGTGKSPFVYLLAKILKEEFNVVVITRGYGRKANQPVVLSDELLPVEITGDEPLMNFIKLERSVPFVICKNRIKAYQVAKQRFDPQVIILDDAFQYRKIIPSYTFLVFDERFFTFNKFLLPAGPMREPIKAGKRADAIVVNYKSGTLQKYKIYQDKPHIHLKYIPSGYRKNEKIYRPNEIEGDVVAFAGIGDPESFRQTLISLGLNIKKFQRFPDHHWYKKKEIEELLKEKLPVITTEKDYIRLPNDLKKKIFALVIEPKIEKGYDVINDLIELIRKSIG